MFEYNPEMIKFLKKVKSWSKNIYNLWITLPKFDLGPRPADLVGKTSMKAMLIERQGSIYYGETSLIDSNKKHGKGILFSKSEPLDLYYSWFFNDKQNGLARMIADD
jgi:hypothetical protein